MLLAIASLLAGVLSALSPCVLPLIPMMLGSQAKGGSQRSIRVLFGLGLSVILFSILLKSSTLLIGIPQQLWHIIGGGVVTLFGLSLLWPHGWEKIVLAIGLETWAQRLMAKAQQSNGAAKDILLGASLGPLFNVCSPTYALIVAVFLPANPLQGFALLVVYTVGLLATLYTIAVGGSKLVKKIGWSLDTSGTFRRTLGIILVVIGVAIIFGLDKQLQTLLVASGAFDWQVSLESLLAQ